MCIGDMADPHAQRLLRNHDEEVSALRVSPDGRWIASGQLGTTHAGGFRNAPVTLWNAANGSVVTVFQGLTHAVTALAFSDPAAIAGSKLGILVGSAVAAVVGVAILNRALPPSSD